jgi:hypothetical protein
MKTIAGQQLINQITRQQQVNSNKGIAFSVQGVTATDGECTGKTSS